MQEVGNDITTSAPPPTQWVQCSDMFFNNIHRPFPNPPPAPLTGEEDCPCVDEDMFRQNKSVTVGLRASNRRKVRYVAILGFFSGVKILKRFWKVYTIFK